MPPKYFPIMVPKTRMSAEERQRVKLPFRISWGIVEPHAEQAQRNHGQTLERLSDRGGLDPDELASVLEGVKYTAFSIEKAAKILRAHQVLSVDPPKQARIIVTGGRKYDDRIRVFNVLDAMNPSEIAEGGATGADTLARNWAFERKVPFRTFRADWETARRENRTKSAGPIRNRNMFAIFEPDGVCAFPGGTGTADMVEVGLLGGAWITKVAP